MTDSEIRKSDKHVFLLGAGFSAGYGAPVMKGFMAQARRKYFALVARNRLDPLVERYEKMMVFQQECMKCSWAFNRDWDNIEELYTQADLLRLARYRDATEAEELCQHIAWAIWDVYRGYEPEKHPPMNYVLESVSKGGCRPVIITTNYDVLCEIGIQDEENPLWRYYYPGFKEAWMYMTPNQGLLEEDADCGIDPRTVATVDKSRVVPLIKLHGSVNWFQYDHGTKLFATTDFGCSRNRKVRDLLGISRPDFELKNLTTSLNRLKIDPNEVAPAIIPPMLGKMSVSPTISREWQAAIECLETAAHITIIGYSFPETDAFMTRLLAEGLKKNNGLEDIAIVDIQAEEKWVKRLKRIFTPTLRQTKVKYEKSDAKDYLSSLAKAGKPEPTKVVLSDLRKERN